MTTPNDRRGEMPEPNSIQDNLANDLNKDYACTVYLTRPERDALEQYCRDYKISHSDYIGRCVWHSLKAAQYLDPGYYRPVGR